jgi:hypothetical protein
MPHESRASIEMAAPGEMALVFLPISLEAVGGASHVYCLASAQTLLIDLSSSAAATEPPASVSVTLDTSSDKLIVTGAHRPKYVCSHAPTLKIYKHGLASRAPNRPQARTATQEEAALSH